MRSKLSDEAGGYGGRKQVRMKYACQNRHAIGQARTGARKIAIRMYRKHAFPGGRRRFQNLGNFHRATFGGGAFDIVAARHDDNYICARFRYFLGGHWKRRMARATQHVFAAGCVDHLRNPVPCDIIRIEPFKTQNTRARPRSGSLRSHFRNLPLKLCCQGFCLLASSGNLAQSPNVVPHVGERMWCE